MAQAATDPFHNVFGIPDGATLTVEASNIVGNVQADGSFMSGAHGVDDSAWTLQQLQNGNAHTALAGPGTSLARVRFVLAQGASVQIDMTVDSPGTKKRGRTWNLAAPNANQIGRCGLVIDVEGAGN